MLQYQVSVSCSLNAYVHVIFIAWPGSLGFVWLMPPAILAYFHHYFLPEVLQVVKQFVLGNEVLSKPRVIPYGRPAVNAYELVRTKKRGLGRGKAESTCSSSSLRTLHYVRKINPGSGEHQRVALNSAKAWLDHTTRPETFVKSRSSCCCCCCR